MTAMQRAAVAAAITQFSASVEQILLQIPSAKQRRAILILMRALQRRASAAETITPPNVATQMEESGL